MEGLFFEQYDAFCRWHRVGRGTETVLYLPGLNIPASWNFLSVATHPALDGTTGILLDGIGSGDSDPSPSFPGTLAAHAEVVAEVIAHLGCGPCTIVGYSFGGSVAIALSLARPDLVKQMVVAEANLTPGGGAASRRIASMPGEAFAETGLPRMLDKLRAAALGGDSLAAAVYGGWRASDPRSLHANARAIVDLPEGFADRLLSLSLPRAFIYGERSVPQSPDAATADAPGPAWLRRHGVTTHIVSGVGHGLMIENPDGFVSALAEAGVPAG